MNFLLSLFKRFTIAITSPFRRLLTSFLKLFNVNLWSAKIVKPLTKWVKQTLTLKPKSKDDYYTIGKYLVFKKLFLAITLVICAAIFIYFTMFATPVQQSPTSETKVVTNETFDYDDMSVKDYTGIANIRSSTGEVVYTGSIEAGVAQGMGTLLNRDGIKVYEGEFAANVYEGEGVSYYENGTAEYVGQFSNNLFNGEGNKYYSDGILQYSGNFQDGQFSGEGEFYGRDGVLRYSGNFIEGSFHGIGVSYYQDGTKEYEGEFFEGLIQGVGSYYSTTGKLVYTGQMHNNGIDYRVLVNSNLEEIEAAFTETPTIVYTDTDSVFVYAQAGVVVTLDARVQIQTTFNSNAQNEAVQDYYYLPSAMPAEQALAQSLELPLQLNAENEISELFSTTENTFFPLASFTELNDEWFFPDGSTESSADSSSQESSSSGDSTTSQSTSSSSTQPSTSGTAQSSASSSQSSDSGNDNGLLDFMEAQKTLYFEVDSDVWQKESELDKTKVGVKRITMFSGVMPEIAVSSPDIYEDSTTTTIADCVAIDYLRVKTPTAFSNIIFQMDKSNSAFVELRNIDHAGKIVKLASYVEGLTYRYCYELTNRNTMQYFSVER